MALEDTVVDGDIVYDSVISVVHIPSDRFLPLSDGVDSFETGVDRSRFEPVESERCCIRVKRGQRSRVPSTRQYPRFAPKFAPTLSRGIFAPGFRFEQVSFLLARNYTLAVDAVSPLFNNAPSSLIPADRPQSSFQTVPLTSRKRLLRLALRT